jgi:hypothetical protein
MVGYPNIVSTKELMEIAMKRPENRSSIPVHDYGNALQSAVSWLGDRYLLASPTPRRTEEPSAYFGESQRWLNASRPHTNARRA